MVADRNNYYFTGIMNILKSEYPGISGGQIYKETPPSFPYLYYRQLNAPTVLSTLSNIEEGVRLSVELNIFSDTTLNDCREIANTVRNFLTKEGFFIDNFAPIENIDASIHRFLIRCNKLET